MLFAAVNPFEHVMDSQVWHFFDWRHLHFHLPWFITKYMVLELLAAVIILAIYIPLSRRAASGMPVKGAFDNAFESLLTFIRDQVVHPNIHEHADRYVPFLWTLFLFILFCNLLGMVPFLGSPTASLSVTIALALCAFAVIHGAPVVEMGPIQYAKSYVPHFKIPLVIAVFLIPMIVFIEVLGHFIKTFVLAVRLFANMFAGHTVLAVILLFILMSRESAWYLSTGITIGSVLGVTVLSLLELFVAFLQAFIFTFLTALFLGSTLHPSH